MPTDDPQHSKDQRVTILLKNYEELIELYKFWFDLMVKVNFYQFAIAGSILSFLFSGKNPDMGGNNLFLVGLWVPIFSGFGIAIMYLFGSRHQFRLDKQIGEIRNELGIIAGARYSVLGYSFVVFALIQFAISSGCLVLFCLKFSS